MPELARAIHRLVRQAFPYAPLSVREVLEKDCFLDAIPDADIRWQMLQARPKNLQDTLVMAMEAEAFQMAEKQAFRPGHLVGNVLGAQTGQEQVEILDSPIDKLINEIKRDREEQRQLMEEFMRKIAAPNRTNCWNCQKPQHFYGDCDKLVRNCWNCGKPGHFYRDCFSHASHNRAKLKQNEQHKVMASEELKVKLNVIQQTLDEVSKRNEQLEAENVNLRNQLSSTQKRLPQLDFAEVHGLKETLEEKKQVLARIQRENVELTKKLEASGVDQK